MTTVNVLKDQLKNITLSDLQASFYYTTSLVNSFPFTHSCILIQQPSGCKIQYLDQFGKLQQFDQVKQYVIVSGTYFTIKSNCDQSIEYAQINAVQATNLLQQINYTGNYAIFFQPEKQIQQYVFTSISNTPIDAQPLLNKWTNQTVLNNIKYTILNNETQNNQQLVLIFENDVQITLQRIIEVTSTANMCSLQNTVYNINNAGLIVDFYIQKLNNSQICYIQADGLCSNNIVSNFVLIIKGQVNLVMSIKLS